MRLFISFLFVALSFNVNAASDFTSKIDKQKDGGVIIHHKLLTWKVPAGWTAQLLDKGAQGFEKTIALKNGPTTVSVFISEGGKENTLALHEVRMKLDGDKKVSRVMWNGTPWVRSQFFKPDPKTKQTMRTTFAVAQKNEFVFSALASTPDAYPNREMENVLSAIEFK